MKVSAVIISLAAMAFALPEGTIEARQGSLKVCPPLDSPLCCETVVDGAAGLTCSPPPKSPKSVKSFVKMCAAAGMGANCCLADVDGTGVVCSAVG